MVAPSITCIYCRAGLTPNTKWAHVWQASLGGRLRSRTICCDDCNNAISIPEKALFDALVHAFASVGAVNDEATALSVAVVFEGNTFQLADGNAILDTPGVRFDPETKSLIVPLPAGFDAQVERFAKLLVSHGKTPDDAEKLELVPGDPGPVLPVGPQLNYHDLSFGGLITHKQVMVKMALELLAYHRHDLAIRGELSEARRFGRYGTGTFSGKPDRRSMGSGLLPTSSLPESYNAIEVWSFGRSVFFRAVFLGPIVFTGNLTIEWTGEPFHAAFAFDARNPAVRIAEGLQAGDGPNLAIFFDEVRDEVNDNLASELEEISRRLASSKPRVEREAPPDVDDLRKAVKQRMAEMFAKRISRSKKEPS